MGMPCSSGLDLLAPSRDVAADLAFYTEALEAEIVFAIEAFERVAQVRLAEAARPSCWQSTSRARHRCCSIASMTSTLPWRSSSGEGSTLGERFGFPHGPCVEFRAPGGPRIAVYELTRPGADAHLAGRHDFGPAAG